MAPQEIRTASSFVKGLPAQIDSFYVYVFYLHIRLCTVCVQYPWRPEEGVRPPEMELTPGLGRARVSLRVTAPDPERPFFRLYTVFSFYIPQCMCDYNIISNEKNDLQQTNLNPKSALFQGLINPGRKKKP